MGSVDRMNQTIRAHDWKHRNMSWRGCHFQTLLRFDWINSWVIYKYHNGKIQYGQFLKKLQNEFISKFKEGQGLKKEEKIQEKKRKKWEKEKMAKQNQV